MSVITKINQNVSNLTVGGPNTPGMLTIMNGQFKMLSDTGMFQIDGINKKMWAGGTSYETAVWGLDLVTGYQFGSILVIPDASITNAKIANATITSAKIASLNADTITTGTLTGRTVQTSATGPRVRLTNGNVLEFLVNDVVYASMYTLTIGTNGVVMELAESSEFKVTMGSLMPIAIVKFNSTDTGLKFDNNKRIYVSSDHGDKIWCDANFVPNSDNAMALGNSAKRWSTLWSKVLNTGDIAFSDEFCPICQKEFAVGDMLINYLYKKDDLNNNYTVPAHFDCAHDTKKNAITTNTTFINEKSDIKSTFLSENVPNMEESTPLD